MMDDFNNYRIQAFVEAKSMGAPDAGASIYAGIMAGFRIPLVEFVQRGALDETDTVTEMCNGVAMACGLVLYNFMLTLTNGNKDDAMKASSLMLESVGKTIRLAHKEGTATPTVLQKGGNS